VPSLSRLLENDLCSRGLLRKESCGASSISCVGEPDGYDTIVKHLRDNVYCYIEGDKENRNTEFIVRNMVAL
jgi:hypothetical protein